MDKREDIKKTENHGVKRRADEDEEFSNTSSGSRNKKWKSNSNSGEFDESSKNFTFTTNKRNRTFANDRLKNLRKPLKTDVVTISTSANPKIFEKPINTEALEWNRFQPTVQISKSLAVNPFSIRTHRSFNPIQKSQEVGKTKLSIANKERLWTSNTVNTTCDKLRVPNLNKREASSCSVKSEPNEYTFDNSSQDARTSTNYSPKKCSSVQETFQNSANSRLSKLRTDIHKGEKWKDEHKKFDNNSNESSISKFSPDEKISLNDNKKINAVDKSDIINCVYVPGKYPCEKSGIYNDWNTSISVNSSFRPIKIITDSHRESSAGDKYAKVDCIPTTSKDKPVIKQELETTYVEEKKHWKEVHWNNKKDYSRIVDSLYKKYFENSENPVKISDKSSQTLETSEPIDCSMDWEDDDVLEPAPDSESKLRANESKELHFVVDTNVFIHDLDILQDLINGSKGNIKPIIYLPWMVISELDFIKDDKKSSTNLKSKAQKAVRYINENILGGKSSIKGQTIHEVDEQKYVGKSPDDKILSCCLLVKEKYHRMIFVSNDCQLRNKVLINGIPALSTSEILNASERIASEAQSIATEKLQEKKQKILEEMSTCCSFIICECAKEAYGRVWHKMSMLSNPPWSLKICLKIFKKYWRGIFQEKFLKQFMQSVDKLEEAFKVLETRKTPSFDEFVEAYIGLCFYFKDLDEHKAFVETSIKDVKSIVHSD